MGADVHAAGRIGVRVVLATLYDTQGGSTRVLLATAAALSEVYAVRVRAPPPVRGPAGTETDAAPAAFPAVPLTSRAAKLAALPRVAGLVAREAAYLRRARPEVVWVHDEPSLYVYGLAARLLAPRPDIVWHLHAGAGRGLTLLLRRALADRIVGVSRHGTAGVGLGAAVLRNPVAPPRSREGVVPGRIVVVGALNALKNAGLALDALATLRSAPGDAPWRLTLIGPEIDAATVAALRRRAAEPDLVGSVDFVGARAHEAVWDGVDGVALFPSLHENQPLALVEAVLAGRPIVATDIPAHREVYADIGADPGRLVPPDPRALAAAIRAARPLEPAVVARARELFAPERFMAGARAVLDGLTRARRR